MYRPVLAAALTPSADPGVAYAIPVGVLRRKRHASTKRAPAPLCQRRSEGFEKAA